MTKYEELFEKFFEEQLKKYPNIVKDEDRKNMKSAYISGALESWRMINKMYENEMYENE